MFHVAMPNLRAASLLVVAAGILSASPLLAAPSEGSDPPPNAMDQLPSMNATAPAAEARKVAVMEPSPAMMQQHVERRIKELHEKLKITSAQEEKWGIVAQTMRENEKTISQLITARHQNPEKMSAVDDLKSYENIAQAHVDGLKLLIPVFASLYNDMSGAQRSNADQAFSQFEGHRGHGNMKKRS